MSRVTTNISYTKLRVLLQRSDRLDELLRAKAESLNTRAAGVFIRQQHFWNENELSQTTPPKYLASFRTRKIQRARNFYWEARNVDPAAAWVEYGAHAGGKTLVLRYRPYTKALVSMAVV